MSAAIATEYMAAMSAIANRLNVAMDSPRQASMTAGFITSPKIRGCLCMR